MAKSRDVDVTIKTSSGDYKVRSGSKLDKAALVWSYIAYNRQRWHRNKDAREELVDQCIKQLKELGISENSLSYLASERVIEVTIPYDDRKESARTMPWEYVLGEALTAWGADPFIVRHLQKQRRTTKITRARKTQQAQPLVVIGARELLDDHYWFDFEIELVGRALGKSVRLAEYLTIDDLRKLIRKDNSDVIHLVGDDIHHGSQLLELKLKASEKVDGMLFANSDGEPVPVDFQELSNVLTAGQSKPSLVVFNIHHSAPRVAAETVAKGVSIALGYQDHCDDASSERFLGQFYRAWAQSKGDALISAFVAWQSLKSFRANSGSNGIVLWSDHSLIDGSFETKLKTAENIGMVVAEKQKPEQAFSSRDAARKNVTLDVKPLNSLNYALLHNRQPMFEQFELRNLDEVRTVPDVRVEVELLAGPEKLSYSANHSIGNAPILFEEKVFVPLTSTLSRSLKESIRAALCVKLSVGEFLNIYESMHRVTLLPVNEWVDDDDNRQWLPSFVFPMDPAIRRILGCAKQFLDYLTDVASSGFDGYQAFYGVEPETDDEASAEESVHAQVEAIWSALVYSIPLTYINPPPTYSSLSQRLRSPSEVLESGHGTCIDLTLLLASALEYIEVFPVVFLLEGHAFPGYWRSEEAWNDFVNLRYVEDLEPREIQRLLLDRGGPPQSHSWVFPSLYYSQIMEQVKSGNLVPLESVWLTSRSKFEDAQDAGWENLLARAEFHSMIDLQLARECDVTPLPKVED